MKMKMMFMLMLMLMVRNKTRNRENANSKSNQATESSADIQHPRHGGTNIINISIKKKNNNSSNNNNNCNDGDEYHDGNDIINDADDDSANNKINWASDSPARTYPAVGLSLVGAVEKKRVEPFYDWLIFMRRVLHHRTGSVWRGRWDSHN